MITKTELFDALAYAACAQQVEITDATVLVYHDQLGRYGRDEIVKAVREWVSRYEEPFRRLPTVGELRAILRSGKRLIASDVQESIRLGVMVDDARRNGASPEEVQQLIDDFDKGLIAR